MLQRNFAFPHSAELILKVRLVIVADILTGCDKSSQLLS